MTNNINVGDVTLKSLLTETLMKHVKLKIESTLVMGWYEILTV